METIKKRHNPEITAEDLAARAFDKNNDALPVKEGLEQKVQSEKGDNALKQEVCHLIEKVFGEGLYLNYLPLEELNTSPNGLWVVTKVKRKAGWFRNAELENYFTISLFEVLDRREDGVVITKKSQPMYENGKFNPIKIIVYAPEALKNAREFVKSYKSLTGQEATLIQECVDEEEMKTHLPKEEKQPLETKVEKYNMPAIKSRLAMMKLDLVGVVFNSLALGMNGGFAIINISEGKYNILPFNIAFGAVGGYFAYHSGKRLMSKYEESLKNNYEE